MTTACELSVAGRVLIGDRIEERGIVLVDRGKVHWVGALNDAPMRGQQHVDCTNDLLVPGFVDVHVHGGDGYDFGDGTREAVAAICAAHARQGTTALVATLASQPAGDLIRALGVIAAAIAAEATRGPSGARLLGVHLEGPFLNPRRAGAHPHAALRAPDLGLLDELLAAGKGTVKVVTLAPELPGALPLIDRLVAAGIVVSLGHSDATYEEAAAAIARGARSVTHLFNAMSPLGHRAPGLAGAALDHPELYAEAIADGVHVHEPLLRLIWRTKQPARRLCLITDCTALGPDVPQRNDVNAMLSGQPIHIAGGAARLADGTLAGSVLGMKRAVQTMVRACHAEIADVAQTASAAPAAMLGVTPIGTLSVGSFADFVALDSAGEIRDVWIGGQSFANLAFVNLTARN